MLGQIRHQIFHHANWAYARAAAAMRNAEGFVQIQMADIAAEFTRCGYAHQRVHIRAIDINAAAVAVHQRAQLFHARFKHAVGAGVGDHDAGQIGAVLLAFRRQISQIHIALLVAFGHHHLHTHHLCAGGVGAVGALRNQADIAMALALRRMVGLYRQQARVFALAAGIGLQANAGIAGDAAQPLLQERI